MNYQVFSANEWVYPDTTIAPDSEPAIALASARGARAACQILLGPVVPNSPMRWRVSGAAAEAAVVEVYQMVDVMVEANTRDFGFCDRDDEKKSDSVTRRAPFRVHDALKPLDDGCGTTRAAVEAFYVSCHVPIDAEPGTHAGSLSIEIGGSSVDIPLMVEVFAAIVPENGTLRLVNWFNANNMATRHGLEPWSDAHWEMIERYGRLMRRSRQTDFIPSVGADVRDVGDGRYEFGFERMERLIRMYFDLGFTWINGPHIAGRREFDAPEFVLSAGGETVNAIGPEGYAYLAQYLPAWHSFLERNGWLDRVVQHVADEPTEKCEKDYRVLSGIVRKFMPGIPIIDALGLPEIGGSVDVWVPIENAYEERREEFEQHRDLGDEIWYYTCCIPGGPHLNRLLDMPLLRTRYLHWANYTYDLTGFLHWGLNQFRGDQDPFEQNCPGHGGGECLPPGDTHIVYPGDDGPWPSVRLEAESMGIEDYELLRIVAECDKPLADEIARTRFRSFVDFDEDPTRFEAAHRRLLAAASS